MLFSKKQIGQKNIRSQDSTIEKKISEFGIFLGIKNMPNPFYGKFVLIESGERQDLLLLNEKECPFHISGVLAFMKEKNMNTITIHGGGSVINQNNNLEFFDSSGSFGIFSDELLETLCSRANAKYSIENGGKVNPEVYTWERLVYEAKILLG